MRKLRLFFVILLAIGLFAFVEGYYLKWIVLDSQYSVFIYDTFHIHHWQLGLVLIVISLIGLFYERKKRRRMIV